MTVNKCLYVAFVKALATAELTLRASSVDSGYRVFRSYRYSALFAHNGKINFLHIYKQGQILSGVVQYTLLIISITNTLR